MHSTAPTELSNQHCNNEWERHWQFELEQLNNISSNYKALDVCIGYTDCVCMKLDTPVSYLRLKSNVSHKTISRMATTWPWSTQIWFMKNCNRISLQEAQTRALNSPCLQIPNHEPNLCLRHETTANVCLKDAPCVYSNWVAPWLKRGCELMGETDVNYTSTGLAQELAAMNASERVWRAS